MATIYICALLSIKRFFVWMGYLFTSNFSYRYKTRSEMGNNVVLEISTQYGKKNI